ncbi:hypothetical protein I3F58_27960 [Streptomyces sp. MUM 203J]|uniref:hypothetical protein n=1 Tax=Streptomyces sp. MUM 203J TaxID=2791990 RepID=UPI001F0491C5|nr:hypothetical protein [Streptomyces sp. MUM 203J]MCH0543316.1 hypothetical protein [Streptomyces sp. MUM 203J]
MEHDQAASPAVSTTRDDAFGEVRVVLDTAAGVVTVSGDRVPTVVIRRRAGDDVEVNAHIPVGTRDGGLLSLTVDGHSVPVRPGKGRLTRRSFRADAAYGGDRYRLVPDSMVGSRLLRGRQRLGEFSSDGDGVVLAEWRGDADVRAVEAALGYALAAAFGTGAQPMWMLALDALGDLIPG